MTPGEMDTVLAGSQRFAELFARLYSWDREAAEATLLRIRGNGSAFPREQEDVFLSLALMRLHEAAAHAHVRLHDPVAITGAKVRAGGRKGGNLRKRANQDALADAVQSAHDENPDWSYTRATDAVAAAHGMSGRQVRRRVPKTW
ncbi:MAG TPA: hypothetical protein VMN60_00520 [Longimicrobiales bacterium]|nr:hypothetical protein [Longimicrobiales bacterium]